MNHDELLKLVRATSIDLMNKGEGDGTIYACYSDDEIIAEFGGKTEAQVIRKVRKLDKATASVFNEVRMASGEYKMVNGVSVSIYELERQAEAKAEAEERAKNKPFEDRNIVVNTLHEVLNDLQRQYRPTTLAGVVVAEAIRSLRVHVAQIESREEAIAEHGIEAYYDDAPF
jgi:flagellar biosynthesis GTPase FlhF